MLSLLAIIAIVAFTIGMGIQTYALLAHFAFAYENDPLTQEQIRLLNHWRWVGDLWLAVAGITAAGGLLLRGGQIPPSIQQRWKSCRKKFTRVIQRVVGSSRISIAVLRLVKHELATVLASSAVIGAVITLFSLSDGEEIVLVATVVALNLVFVAPRTVRVIRQ